jgi:hypothetical protein
MKGLKIIVKLTLFAAMAGPGGFNNSTRSWNMVIPLND